MRWCVIFFLVLVACAPVVSQVRQDSTALPFAVVDERELIVLTAEPPQTLIGRAEALGYRLQAVHPLPDLGDTLVSLRIPDGTSIPQAIDEIEAAVPGVTAGANHVYRLQAIDRTDGRNYAAMMIGWPPQGCRARVRVGMVDAGVGASHPGLTDGRIAERGFVGGASDTHSSHGTVVAELLIGPNRLRDTTLLSARVIDPVLPGGDAAGVVAILRGVDWLANEGAKVINISLAGPYNKLMDRALGQAAANGMTIVAAAGNLGPGASPQYPAAFPFALAVTAVDRDGRVYRNAIRGPHIDIAAPGVDILTMVDGRLQVSSGTSLAAPFVTGVLATTTGVGDLGMPALRAELARRAADLGASGPDEVFGAGLLRSQPKC